MIDEKNEEQIEKALRSLADYEEFLSESEENELMEDQLDLVAAAGGVQPNYQRFLEKLKNNENKL